MHFQMLLSPAEDFEVDIVLVSKFACLALKCRGCMYCYIPKALMSLINYISLSFMSFYWLDIIDYMYVS